MAIAAMDDSASGQSLPEPGRHRDHLLREQYHAMESHREAAHGPVRQGPWVPPGFTHGHSWAATPWLEKLWRFGCGFSELTLLCYPVAQASSLRGEWASSPLDEQTAHPHAP